VCVAVCVAMRVDIPQDSAFMICRQVECVVACVAACVAAFVAACVACALELMLCVL